MKKKPLPTFAVIGVALTLLISLTLLAQRDQYALKVPDGLAFSEFKGYDTWQAIAVSETKTSVKAILGNPTMIQAYKEGVPDNRKLFPEGSKTVKIEWLKKENTESPYFVEVPDVLKSLSFIEKDSKSALLGEDSSATLREVLALARALQEFLRHSNLAEHIVQLN